MEQSRTPARVKRLENLRNLRTELTVEQRIAHREKRVDRELSILLLSVTVIALAASFISSCGR